MTKEPFSIARQGACRTGSAEELHASSYSQQTHLPTQLLCAHPQVLQTLHGPEQLDLRSKQALIRAGSWTRDLLTSFQPDLFHDATFVHHGRSSQATTISSYAPPIKAEPPSAPSPDTEAPQPDFPWYLAYPFCQPSWYRSPPELAQDLEEPMPQS